MRQVRKPIADLGFAEDLPHPSRDARPEAHEAMTGWGHFVRMTEAKGASGILERTGAGDRLPVSRWKGATRAITALALHAIGCQPCMGRPKATIHAALERGAARGVGQERSPGRTQRESAGPRPGPPCGCPSRRAAG